MLRSFENYTHDHINRYLCGHLKFIIAVNNIMYIDGWKCKFNIYVCVLTNVYIAAVGTTLYPFCKRDLFNISCID